MLFPRLSFFLSPPPLWTFSFHPADDRGLSQSAASLIRPSVPSLHPTEEERRDARRFLSSLSSCSSVVPRQPLGFVVCCFFSSSSLLPPPFFSRGECQSSLCVFFPCDEAGDVCFCLITPSSGSSVARSFRRCWRTEHVPIKASSRAEPAQTEP